MSFSFSIYVSLFSLLSTFLILPLCLPWDLTSACRGLHRNPALPAGDLACSVPAGKGQGLCMPRVSSLRRCRMSQRATGHKPAHGWAHLRSGAISRSRWLWWTQVGVRSQRAVAWTASLAGVAPGHRSWPQPLLCPLSGAAQVVKEPRKGSSDLSGLQL